MRGITEEEEDIMSKQKLIKQMTGYKATDANMRCHGFQFVLGEWAEASGDILLCKNGFHFCKQASGPRCYYDAVNARVFKVEAEGVLKSSFQAGADYKRVCRRIRLVEEVFIAGDGNTGYFNTGDHNTGDFNTGDRNTGDRNTGNGNAGNGNAGNGNAGNLNTGNGNAGNFNTGNGNTGDFNAGYGNAGNLNAGNRNAGYGNTGDGNAGDDNAGTRNTGDYNVGDGNTGYGNATSCSPGFFCQEEPNVICFDVDTRMKRNEFMTAFPCWSELVRRLLNEGEITFDGFSRLPGITPKKLKALHAKHLVARRESQSGEPPTTNSISKVAACSARSDN